MEIQSATVESISIGLPANYKNYLDMPIGVIKYRLKKPERRIQSADKEIAKKKLK